MKLVLDMIKYYIKWCVQQRKVNCYKSTKMLIHEIFSLLLLDFNLQKNNRSTVKSLSNNMGIFRIFWKDPFLTSDVLQD